MKKHFNFIKIIFLCYLIVLFSFMGCESKSQELDNINPSSFKISVNEEIDKLNMIVVSYDEYYAVLSQGRGTIIIKELITDKIIKQLQNIGYVSQIRFSPDGRYLAILADDKVNIFEIPSFNKVFSFKGNTGESYCMEFNNEGDKIFVGGANRKMTSMADQVKGQLTYWDISKRTKLDSKTDFSDMITSISLSPDGGSLAILNRYEISVLDLTKPKTLKKIKSGEIDFQSVDFFNSGFDLIIGTGQIRGWVGELLSKSLTDNSGMKIIEKSDSCWFSFIKSIHENNSFIYLKENGLNGDNKIEIRSSIDFKILFSIKSNDDKYPVFISSDGRFLIKKQKSNVYELIPSKELIQN